MAGGAETPNIAALPAIARLGACESARGPDADRRVKLLIQFAVEGSLSGAYSQYDGWKVSGVDLDQPNSTSHLIRSLTCAVSESGQSRRFDCVPPTSALPPSTDIVRSARQVRFVPTTDVKDNVARRAAAFTCETPMGSHRPTIPPYAPSGASQSYWPKGQFHDSAIRLTISQ